MLCSTDAGDTTVEVIGVEDTGLTKEPLTASDSKSPVTFVARVPGGSLDKVLLSIG
jgi:hypothetical protein